jgi:hypothetical protein
VKPGARARFSPVIVNFAGRIANPSVRTDGVPPA